MVSDDGPMSGGAEQREREAGADAAVVADLLSGERWRGAAAALVESAREGPGIRPLVLLAATLATSAPEPDGVASRARDHPRRQRLAHLTGLLLALPADERRRMRATINGVAAALGADRSLLDLQQRLRLGTLDWRSPSQVRQVLLEAVGQCATRPLQTRALAARVEQALEYDSAGWDPDALLRMAGELATRAGLTAPRVALAMAAVAGRRTGWDDSWRDLVLSLRGHPDPDVASAARSIYTAAE